MKDDPAILIGSDGNFYVQAESLTLADRVGRRVVRVIALTAGEQEALRRATQSLASDIVEGIRMHCWGPR